MRPPFGEVSASDVRGVLGTRTSRNWRTPAPTSSSCPGRRWPAPSPSRSRSVRMRTIRVLAATVNGRTGATDSTARDIAAPGTGDGLLPLLRPGRRLPSPRSHAHLLFFHTVNYGISLTSCVRILLTAAARSGLASSLAARLPICAGSTDPVPPSGPGCWSRHLHHDSMQRRAWARSMPCSPPD
jgi:hypothetical protein